MGQKSLCSFSCCSLIHSRSIFSDFWCSKPAFHFLKAVLYQGFTLVVSLFSFLGNGLNYHALITYFPSTHTERQEKYKQFQWKQGLFYKQPSFRGGGKVGKSAISQTLQTSSCFLLLFFPWHLVEVGFIKLPSNIQKHRWDLFNSWVLQGRHCPGKTSCCCSCFALKHFASPNSFLCSYTSLNERLWFEASISWVPVTW